MKNTANIITSLRILFAVVMLAARPFSALFWACYFCAGISDILDGIVARKLKQQSKFGAKLDSTADIVFACAIATVVIVNLQLPHWLWICVSCIALLRFVGYLVGYIKYRTFSALHTYANKATGMLVFLFPLLYILTDIQISGIILSAVAFASASEELLITLRSDKLNRERRSLLFK